MPEAETFETRGSAAMLKWMPDPGLAPVRLPFPSPVIGPQDPLKVARNTDLL